ncbi:hypothetical protein M2480_002630 [Parabacteroides sp. PFB2-12]|uniref:acyloxyacyl hydrolase n=1 Tax=unclassified Parabacteroides TaxID=2649774 RepID=UPI00247578F7|nr:MULTISPECIES: acyloxyacyl hydrolase [unclassified Parabacteroides]MDH6341829.1 hypothetical protein [Parabacteroides sp. PM6-13]MDH6391632.1 hypothetical protein [Parabacteroides sp. PFB2-12]
MRQKCIWVIIWLLATGSLLAEGMPVDSLTKKRDPQFLAINMMGGVVLPTNAYIKAGNRMPAYSALSLKYGFASSGESWQDVAYGMPYYGIGFYSARFFHKKALGNPFSLYLFQGARIRDFSRKTWLGFELNLGMSFNWKAYDAFDNPDNIALGSAVNIHVGANLYMTTSLSKRVDLRYGLGVSHFSNGAQQLPNKGLNMAAPFVEVVYKLQDDKEKPSVDKELTPPPVDPHFNYDLTFTSTTRQIWMDTLGTNLPSRLIDKNFKVFGVSFSALYTKNYKYRWGPSVEIVYDESSGAHAWRQQHPVDGKYYDRIRLAPFFERLSLGVSLRGEVTYPHHSFFCNLGYNLLHGNSYDFRFYQILGVKAYLKENIFGTFGIRAARFSKAQYLYWSIGYTIPGKPLKSKVTLQ